MKVSSLLVVLVSVVEVPTQVSGFLAPLGWGVSNARPLTLDPLHETASVEDESVDEHPSVFPHISPLNRLGNDQIFAPTADPLPLHPDVQSGTLDNGLPYVILPNKSPAGRFEVHLQVFSGSADELESQQGIAHLTEHVAYMGSTKRGLLANTGSQTNAYTDFHHTVFYAICPTKAPGSGVPMLPMALDALVDVMEARVEKTRLEKERAAVLSEMTMVNTIEYRVECQILSTLHRENRLAKRFPIGKEKLIRNWKTEDVLSWHRTHYRPDNVLLYVVGDIDPVQAKEIIQLKFGALSAARQAEQIVKKGIKEEARELAKAVVSGTVKAAQSWHYPPLRHDWCVANDVPIDPKLVIPAKREGYDIDLQKDYPLDEDVFFLKTEEVSPGKKIRPHIFRHGLLQAFSMHLFCKRPVEPIVDLNSLRRNLARRIALAALQIRLNVGGRSDNPAFTFVEFNQLDSAREGCAICSLDMTAEPHKWKYAIQKALTEITKLGKFGVTFGELQRYTSTLMTDVIQTAAQGEHIPHGDQVAHLMESVSNGHTFMSANETLHMTSLALATLTLEHVNQAAKELCSHVNSLKDGEDPLGGPVIAVACTPEGTDKNSPGYCDEDSLVKTIYDACQVEVEPEEDVEVPYSLVPEETLNKAMKEHPPEWLPGTFTDGTPSTSAHGVTRPFTLRRLNNGVRVGVAYNPFESQRAHIRMVAPGGRDAEKRLGLKPGSMTVGALTMQEGGAFGPWTREQVELFCVDHLLMVQIKCNEESIVWDFTFPTTSVGNVGIGPDSLPGITGTESVLQVIREIIGGFRWEPDALGRSKSSLKATHETMEKNLEKATLEKVMNTMMKDDSRFMSVDVAQVEDVTLAEAQNAVMSQLMPSNLEISVSGDVNTTEVLDMIHKYVGTIPADINKKYEIHPPADAGDTDDRSVPTFETPGKFVELELSDPDPRAVAYVAGSAPNAWGFLADGSNIADHILEKDTGATDVDHSRRRHPLFAHVALMLLSEILNRRLFSNVRESKQLTYDANFSFGSHERLLGGWFLVTVTASQDKAQKALEACKETLRYIRTSSPISMENLESAKRAVLSRNEMNLQSPSYWTEKMTGLQEESIPLKGPLSFTHFGPLVEAITPKDLQLLLETLGTNDEELYSAIGRTIRPETLVGDLPDVELVRQPPVIGMGRGHALTG
eukprot:Nitzschia sp. Nitz4//scaffold46_size129759//113169//116946//NITZ4_003524-RA/size129759-augustus-gene-0.27-mRNA-1//-1//CDS//3329552664//9170//frame0